MASLTWFFDGTYSRKQLRQLIGALVGGKVSTRTLGGHSGITSPVVLSATTTTWSVGPFTGILDIETDGTMGPSPFIFDATTTGSITAASASFDRWDLLSLTMADPSTLPTIVYTAGTSASTLPATPANSIALAQVTVPKSGTGSPSMSLIAPIASAVGGIMQVASSGSYPDQPYKGQAVYDVALGCVLIHDGVKWQRYSPTAARRVVTASITVPSGNVPTSPTSFTGGDLYNLGDIGYSAGVFTVATAGVYRWGAQWVYTPAGGDGVYRIVGACNKNGSLEQDGEKSQIVDTGAFSGGAFFDSTSGVVIAAAGDTFQLSFQKTGTGASLVVSVRSFSFERVA